MEAMDTAEAVEQYGTMVYRLAYAQCRSRADADDLFHEVFLRYHRAAPVFDSEEHRKAWLLRVTVNCAKKLWSSPWRRRSTALEDVYTYSDPEASAVDEALAGLPSGYRTVIHLFYYEGYGAQEIARLLGRKPSTVRTQLTRGRQLLAQRLKEDL